MLKRILAVALAAAMMVSAMSGCTSKKGAGADPNAKTIKIGGLAPLTGDVSVYGVATNNGILLAVDEINKAGGVLGKQIEYKCYDEKGDSGEAMNDYNKLVSSDKIVALVGDVTSKPTLAVAQLAAKDNMPMISATATAENVTSAGKNVFRACFIDPFQGELMASYGAKKLSGKTAAIIYDTSDDYSKGLMEAFQKSAKDLGMNIVATEGYAKNTVDFKSQLTNIKSKNPDILFLPVYYQSVALISVQAKQIGLNAKLLGADGWDGVIDKIDKSNLDAINGSFFCSQYSAESTDPNMVTFLKKYKETYKTDANQFAVLGYDAMKMMAQAIKNAKSTDSDAIIKAMAAIDYTGLTGHTKFDDKRNPIKSAAITTIADGKYKFVEFYQK